jgi:hypothetical protein
MTEAQEKVPLACNELALAPAERKRHFEEVLPAVVKLGKRLNNHRELPDGFEFEFPSDAPAVMTVAEFAWGEHLCCPFVEYEFRLERRGGFWLRLTGPGQVKDFIRSEYVRPLIAQ